MGQLTADALRERMAKIKADKPERCGTCKAIAKLAPDVGQVVEEWFDDEDTSARQIGDAIGVGEKSVRRHRAKHRGEQD